MLTMYCGSGTCIRFSHDKVNIPDDQTINILCVPIQSQQAYIF